VWLVLWLCGFGVIEYGIGLLGLVTLSFVISAWRLQPDLCASLLPSSPTHHYTRYAFLAISIVGATVSSCLLNFYSSGTVEERVTESELWVILALELGPAVPAARVRPLFGRWVAALEHGFGVEEGSRSRTSCR
jgi:Mn2+/Fe2+ NRAMP family transporter